jgi:peptide/nickel transport system substrate-binding protein
LATSWEVNDTGLVWTFKLRKGVKFHNGTPFTAQDVKDSLERVVKKEHPFHGYGKWGIVSRYLEVIKEVKIVDDHTMKIVTNSPYAPLPNSLTIAFAPILSSKVMAEMKDKVVNKPIGTGPFKFVRWDKDDQFVVERNEDYWGQKPYVDRLIIKAIPDPSARLMALQSGAIDIADDLDPDSIALVRKDAKLRVLEKTGCGISYLAMNTTNLNLANVLVRRAINHAIDKKALIKTIFRDLAIPAKNPFPPTAAWGYNDDIKPYEYNPTEAKALLKRAGLPNGFEINFFIMPVSRPYMPDPLQAAELIQAHLAQVGIKAKIVRYDWATYLQKTREAEHDICILGWMGANGDPDAFLYLLLSGKFIKTSTTRWNNVEYTSLVGDARVIFDQKEREKMYRRAQEIFHEEAPWVPLVHNKVIRCINKRVHDVPLSPTNHNSMEMVWKEK